MTRVAVTGETAAGQALRLASTAAVVAERIVTLAHRLAKADVARSLDEVEPLLRVAGDAVEQRAEEAGLREPEVLGGLVAEQLQHDQLVHRESRHAPGQSERVIQQLAIGDDLEDESDVGGLAG